MKTTNWNFYLCNESRNKEYLEFTLSRVWSIDDETADNLDKQLFFTYTIEPTLSGCFMSRRAWEKRLSILR